MNHLIGSPVSHRWGSMTRYGVITNARLAKNGWTFVKVNWANDHKFIAAEEVLHNQRAEGLEKAEYRIDKLQLINIEETVKTLQLLQKELETQ